MCLFYCKSVDEKFQLNYKYCMINISQLTVNYTLLLVVYKIEKIITDNDQRIRLYQNSLEQPNEKIQNKPIYDITVKKLISDATFNCRLRKLFQFQTLMANK